MSPVIGLCKLSLCNISQLKLFYMFARNLSFLPRCLSLTSFSFDHIHFFHFSVIFPVLPLVLSPLLMLAYASSFNFIPELCDTELKMRANQVQHLFIHRGGPVFMFSNCDPILQRFIGLTYYTKTFFKWHTVLWLFYETQSYKRNVWHILLLLFFMTYYTTTFLWHTVIS